MRVNDMSILLLTIRVLLCYSKGFPKWQHLMIDANWRKFRELSKPCQG